MSAAGELIDLEAVLRRWSALARAGVIVSIAPFPAPDGVRWSVSAGRVQDDDSVVDIRDLGDAAALLDCIEIAEVAARAQGWVRRDG